jgi:hypothetical protein
MFGREYMQHLAALKLIEAVREAAEEMEPEQLVAHLSFQSKQAEHITSGDTCYIGQWPGDGWLP